MTKSTILKLKDFLKQYRINHNIQDEIVYGQITISKSNSVSFRENKIGKEIGRKRQFIIDLQKYPNTVIFTRQGVFEGSIGFAPPEVDGCIATENMPMFSIDNKKVLPELFNYFLKSPIFKNKVQELTQTGSAQKSIHERDLLELEFSFPSNITEQKNIAKKIDFCFLKISQINQQIEFDQQNISQLKQAILQEAISGQLTAEWRKENPIQKANPDTDAAALLAKIKAEKQQLIADGKLKKEKPLPAISPDEIPFSLPDSWVWCRLGEICTKITDGFHNTPKKQKSGITYISATHVKSNNINWNYCDYVDEDNHRELWNKAYPQKGEILIVNIGAGCGTPAIIDIDYEFSFKNTAILKFSQNLIINSYFLYYLISVKEKNYSELTQGGLQPFLSLKVLNSILFSLPPLAEQKAIVEKVDYLMKIIDQLEAQIKHRKQLAEDLMQTVLREAFE
jgi:type I restriction enzyme S subunit